MGLSIFCVFQGEGYCYHPFCFANAHYDQQYIASRGKFEMFSSTNDESRAYPQNFDEWVTKLYCCLLGTCRAKILQR